MVIINLKYAKSKYYFVIGDTMTNPLKRVAVTGGAGQISYNLLFRIASGEVFGPDQPIALHILELPVALGALKGVQMELEDCSYPLLQEIKIGTDPYKIFEGINCAIFVGAKPRSPGMERKDLLQENGKHFVEQGKALGTVAMHDVISLVVGNPCNTNCLVLAHHAPEIANKQFFAMTRLDQNRAQYQLAHFSKKPITDVTNMTIWGNHSATQVPDFLNAKIGGKPAKNVISDEEWLKTTFIKTIQQRGAEVLRARGKSSAASAANAICDALRDISHPSHTGSQFSSAIFSTNNPYDIEDNLFFSFPCISTKPGEVKIVEDFEFDDFLHKKIKATEKELIQERDLVRHLLK